MSAGCIPCGRAVGCKGKSSPSVSKVTPSRISTVEDRVELSLRVVGTTPASTTISILPPIIKRCSTSSRRTRTRQRFASMTACSITLRRGRRGRQTFDPSVCRVANDRIVRAMTPTEASTTTNITTKMSDRSVPGIDLYIVSPLCRDNLDRHYGARRTRQHRGSNSPALAICLGRLAAVLCRPQLRQTTRGPPSSPFTRRPTCCRCAGAPNITVFCRVWARVGSKKGLISARGCRVLGANHGPAVGRADHPARFC